MPTPITTLLRKEDGILVAGAKDNALHDPTKAEAQEEIKKLRENPGRIYDLSELLPEAA